MILVSTVVNKELYDIVNKYESWIEETFISDATEERFDRMIRAVRENNPRGYILVVITEELRGIAEQMKRAGICDAVCTYDEREIEESILYQGSPAVHRLVDNYRKQLTELRDSHSSEDTTEALEKLNELENNLRDAELEITARDNRIKELSDEKERLKESINELQAARQQSSVEAGAQQAASEERYRAKLQEYEDKLAQLTAECAKETGSMADAIRLRDDSINDLRTQLDNAHTQIEILKKGNERQAVSSDALEDLRAELNDARRELAEKTTEVYRLQSANDDLESELNASSSAIESFKDREAQSKARLDIAESRNTKLKAEMDRMRDEYKNTDAKSAELEAEVARLRVELEDTQNTETGPAEARLLSLGLENYRGKAMIIGVCGYGSSFYTANAAVSVAYTLGALTDVALIDLDPSYSSMNSLMGVKRLTYSEDMVDENGNVVMDNVKHKPKQRQLSYIKALNEKQVYTKGMCKVFENKSGSVYYGGGCLGGINTLDKDRFVQELNGLAGNTSYIVLNLGCFSMDLLPVLSEISSCGRIVSILEGRPMPIRYMAGQFSSLLNIPVREVHWILASDVPITDDVVEKLSGANIVTVGEELASSRANIMGMGIFSNTFRNFVNVLTQ